MARPPSKTPAPQPTPQPLAPSEPYFIEEGDEDPLHGQLPPNPTLYRARDLYDIRPGETVKEAMDRVSREAEDAAAARKRT